MSDFKKLDAQELENVSGGEGRTINTGSSVTAIVRSGPGFGYGQIGSLTNGTYVNTTGLCQRADGRTWYQINVPYSGWVAGSLIGLPDRY